MWFNILIVIAFFLSLGYSFFILLYRYWFLKLEQYVLPHPYKNETSFSVVVPARDEAESIEQCVESILAQNYPQHLFELIVVDDHSTDNTPDLVVQLQKKYSNLKLISLQEALKGKPLNAYKKKAIEIAIGTASFDWIVTTDADCIAPKQWLQYFDAIIQERNPVFVAAPVAFIQDDSMLSAFQTIDFMGLQGVTAASVSAGFHSMCNGANLTYQKKAFYVVNGFKGIDNIASGDDMLLMNKLRKKFPNQLQYLFCKEAIVETLPMPNWRSFLNQRIRWASKADKFEDKSMFWVLALVYFYNVLLCSLPFIAFWQPIALIWLILFVLIKVIVELIFGWPIAQFFDFKFKWKHLSLQPMHIIYTVTAGWLGKFGAYSWKDRKVK